MVKHLFWDYFSNQNKKKRKKYVLFPCQSSVISPELLRHLNSKARELKKRGRKKKKERKKETMAALCKCTSLNCSRKAFCCLANSLKDWSNFFWLWKFSVFYYNLLLSKSDTSLTTKQVVIGLWHHNWNNSRSDFGRHHLTFSHYTFQDVSFIFLFPWIQKDFFLIKG